MRSRMRPRPSKPSASHAGWAARPRTAIARTASAPRSGTWAMTSPVAGFSTGIPSAPDGPAVLGSGTVRCSTLAMTSLFSLARPCLDCQGGYRERPGEPVESRTTSSTPRIREDGAPPASSSARTSKACAPRSSASARTVVSGGSRTTREVEVVEADHRDVAGDRQPEVARREVRAAGHEVVVAQQRGGPRLSGEQLAGGDARGLEADRGGGGRVAGGVLAGGAQRRDQRAPAPAEGLLVDVGADVADPAVPERQQVLDGRGDPRLDVEAHERDVLGARLDHDGAQVRVAADGAAARPRRTGSRRRRRPGAPRRAASPSGRLDERDGVAGLARRPLRAAQHARRRTGCVTSGTTRPTARAAPERSARAATLGR